MLNNVIVSKNPLWFKLSSFSLILFFILLGDGILSFWVPNFLQETLGNPFLMGITMSFSSFVGFGADILFPQLLKKYSVGKLLLAAIAASLIFVVNLAIGVSYPTWIVLLSAMAIWGIYYEFLGFASQQFVADTVPKEYRTRGWALMSIFKNLAYFVGPLLAGLLILKGEHVLLGVAALFTMIGFLGINLSKSKHEVRSGLVLSEINILREISHWKVLLKRVWPIVFLSLFGGLIDATFWTTGAVWTESLAKTSFWGVFLLPAYQLPFLFVGMIMAKLNIVEGKKRIADKFLLFSGLSLVFLFFKLPVIVYVIIVLISSIFLAITHPLIEAVYTDITARLGTERKHLVGLSNSTTSLAYIISPTVAGFIASLFGEQMTLVLVGGIAVLVAFFLMLVTPKKILLPESEITKWED